MLAHSRPDFGPSNHLFWASSAFKLFEAGLRSLKSAFSGQQCLQVIRGRTLVPRIAFFGPAVPSSYSRPDFGPSNQLFRASSAFKLFEAGLRSLESTFLGQQCLQVIRGRTSVPRIAFFGPAVPSSHSRPDFGPSNRLFQASSAFKSFEARLRSLESPFSGQQCLQVIRGRTSVSRIAFFGPAVPSSYSSPDFGPSNRLFRTSSTFKLFEAGLRTLESSFTV
jgi:hypothetical protein